MRDYLFRKSPDGWNIFDEYHGGMKPVHKYGIYEFGDPKYLYEIPPLKEIQETEIAGYQFSHFSIERSNGYFTLWAHHGPHSGVVGTLEKDIPELPDYKDS